MLVFWFVLVVLCFICLSCVCRMICWCCCVCVIELGVFMFCCWWGLYFFFYLIWRLLFDDFLILYVGFWFVGFDFFFGGLCVGVCVCCFGLVCVGRGVVGVCIIVGQWFV